MKPKPFCALKNFTVPTVMVTPVFLPSLILPALLYQNHSKSYAFRRLFTRPGNRGAPKIQPASASGSDLGRLDLQELARARDRDRPRLHGLRNLAHEVDV